MRSRSVVVAVVALAAAVLPACSSGGSDDTASTTTAKPASSAPAPTTRPRSTTQPPRTTRPATQPADTCAGFRGATSPVASTGETAAASLVDAVAGAQGCLDVVTFVFRTRGNGPPPGYTVGYRNVDKEPFTRGDPPQAITVPGEAHLAVSIKPALSTDPSAPNNPSTYPGNLSLRYGAHNHLQVVQKLDDGPDTVNWVIGLDSVRPFRVDRSQDLVLPGVVRVSILIG